MPHLQKSSLKPVFSLPSLILSFTPYFCDSHFSIIVCYPGSPKLSLHLVLSEKNTNILCGSNFLHVHVISLSSLTVHAFKLMWCICMLKINENFVFRIKVISEISHSVLVLVNFYVLNSEQHDVKTTQ